MKRRAVPQPRTRRNSSDPALALLIEGQQRLLAIFDARQASADAKLTAALTGALALPTVTFSLASPAKLSSDTPVLGVNRTLLLGLGYGAVVAAAILILALRLWNGGKWRPRVEPEQKQPPDVAQRESSIRRAVRASRHRHLKFSTESDAQEQARVKWGACSSGAHVRQVQDLALELWRSHAEHSRKLAQEKERLAAAAGGLFAIALAVPVLLLFLR